MAEMQTDVVLDVQDQLIKKAMGELEATLLRFQQLARGVGAAGAQGLGAFDVKLQKSMRQLNDQLGLIESTNRNITRTQRGAVNAVVGDQRFAGQVTQAERATRTLRGASTAADALDARLNKVNEKLVNLGSQGNITGTRNLNRQKEGLENLRKEINALDRDLARLERRGGNVAPAQAARGRLETALLDGRRRNFSAELGGYRGSIGDVQAQRDLQARYLREARSAQSTVGRADASRAVELFRQELGIVTSTNMVMERKRAIQAELARLQTAFSAAGADQKKGIADALVLEQRRLSVAERRLATLTREEQQRKQAVIAAGRRASSAVERTIAAREIVDLRRELSMTTDLSMLDLRREQSAARLKTLLDQQAAAKAVDKPRLADAIAQEDRRNRVIQNRIDLLDRAREREARQTLTADARLNQALGLRQARADERTLGGTLSLPAARERQLLLQDRINERTREALVLTGREKLAAMQQLQIDEARLAILNRQVATMARREAVEGRPGAPFGGMFGQAGLTGVFARTAAYGAAGSALFAGVAAGQQSIQAVIELEDKLKTLQAVANATDIEMRSLAGSIMEVGRGSRFSLTELTEISTKLAQAGVAVSEMQNALRAVTTLATASGSTPDEAVDLVTGALGAFQLQGAEAARVADLMTNALNRTRLTVQQAALAIQYVGATAYEQNISLEQLLSTSAALSQAGVRSGSTIGTGMRQFLVDLQNPSEKLQEALQRLNLTQSDVNVTTRGLPAVLRTLSEAGFGASQAYGALETRAAAFYLVAKNNIPLMAELQISMAQQGAAALANERAMNSLTAQWQRFKNIMTEGFAEATGGILNLIRDSLRGISDELEEARRLRAEGERGSNWFRWLEGFNEAGGPGGGSTPYLMYQLMSSALERLGRDSADATGQAERLTAAINQQADTLDTSAGKVSALDHEIARLATQQDSLRRGSPELAAETVSLMSRFEGLAQHIDMTTLSANGLIGALSRLRAQEAGLIVEQAQAQIQNYNREFVDASNSGNSALARLRGRSDLPAEIRQSLTQLNGGRRADAAARLGDYANRIRTQNPELAGIVDDVVNAQGRRAAAISGARVTTMTRDNARFEARAPQVVRNLREIEGQVAGLSGLTQADRQTRGQALLRRLSPTQQFLRGRQGQQVEQWYQQGVNNALQQAQSLEQQIRASMAATSDETRAGRAAGRASARAGREADRDAQMIEFGSPVRNFSPGRVTSGVGRRNRPQGRNGQRGSSNHQGVDIGGRSGEDVLATADGVVAVAEVRGGYGKYIELNHGGGTKTRYGHLSEILVRVGQRVSRGEVIGRMGATGTATGTHLHYERQVGRNIDRNPLSSTARGNLAEIDSEADRLQEQEADRARRNELSGARLETGTAARELRDKIRDLRGVTSSTVFDAGVAEADRAFTAWERELREQAAIELSQRDATQAERREHMRELEERIEAQRGELDDALFNALIGQVQRAFASANDAFERSFRPQQDQIARIQGQIEGLGYQTAQDRGVPDFVEQLAQRRLGRAQEDLGRARLAGLPEQITSQRQRLANAQIKFEMEFGSSPEQADRMREALAPLTDEINRLEQERLQLDAAFGASGLFPASFSEGIRMAAEAYAEVNGLNRTWQQTVMMNMTSGLSTVHSGFRTFFSDVISGTKSVSAAFGDMVMSVANWMSDLAAQMIANAAFKWLLNLLMPGMGLKADVRGMMASNPDIFYHGGHVVKAYNGRHITSGVPGRDSVNARLSKGEFVLRRAAVDSLGLNTVQALNERGAGSLQRMAPGVVVSQAPKQEMSVYVVAPEERPQLRPGDVLVTIANDIMNGGQTKELIRHVAQGG